MDAKDASPARVRPAPWRRKASEQRWTSAGGSSAARMAGEKAVMPFGQARADALHGLFRGLLRRSLAAQG